MDNFDSVLDFGERFIDMKFKVIGYFRLMERLVILRRWDKFRCKIFFVFFWY